MLYPYSRSWTRAQKWSIATALALIVVLAATLVCLYELHLRRTIEASLIEHQWSMQGCIDCSTDITFHADHTIDVEEGGVGGPYRGKGSWYLSGRDVVVVDYAIRQDGSTAPPDHGHQSLKVHGSTAYTISVHPILYAREK